MEKPPKSTKTERLWQKVKDAGLYDRFSVEALRHYENYVRSSSDIPWYSLAYCQVEHVPPEIFEGDPVTEVKTFMTQQACARCVVKGSCLEDALSYEDTLFFRAGLKPRQLKDELKKRKR